MHSALWIPRLIATLLASALLEVGCATHPAPPVAPAPWLAAPTDQGAVIAAVAASLVGTPYHFGGADESGFDCSGLALYVHQRAGLAIPRAFGTDGVAFGIGNTRSATGYARVSSFPCCFKRLVIKRTSS